LPFQVCISDDNNFEILSEAFQLTRVYKNPQMTINGRYHCAAQGLPKELRKHLVVDGEPATEYDFSNLFPTIAYALEGQETHDDLYFLNGLPRKDVKSLFNMALNCNSRSSAVKAYIQETGDIEAYNFYNNILIEIENKHQTISKFFYNEAWKVLMKVESDIATKIMRYFIMRSEFILPIHDSFIVRQSLGLDLEAIMKWAFQKVTGQNPRIKKEF
jgi:hypothetical protein